MSNSELGERFEALIAELVASGRYASAGDVLRDGLHLLERRERNRESKLDALRADIREGLDSGPAEALDMEAIKAAAREELQRSARTARHGA